MKIVTYGFENIGKARTRRDRVRVQTLIPDEPHENRTKQEFLEETNLNVIMARVKQTGILPDSVRRQAGRYGDFSQTPDFFEMQDKIVAANRLFEALPAKVRKQFSNDPGEFIRASQTEEGRDLMIKLGLGAPEKALADAVGVPQGEGSLDKPKKTSEAKGDPKKEKPGKSEPVSTE